MINVAILTVSSAIAEGRALDASGPAVRDCLPPGAYAVKDQMLLGPDKGLISAVIEKWCRPESGIQLVVTTGATGVDPDDIIPEAVSKVLQVLVPGIPEAIRHAGMQRSPRAMLSRGVAGVRNNTLVVTLPGNPASAREAMQIILPALQHAVAHFAEPTDQAA